jgi:hypothetical protein
LKKHNISVQISEYKEGAYLSSGSRYRLVKNKLYPVNAFFARDNYLYYDKIKHEKEIVHPEKKMLGGFVKPGFTEKRFVTEKQPVLFEDIKKYALVTEGLPFIGVKLSVKLKRMGSKLIPWLPDTDLTDKGITTNTRMVKINYLRVQLYDSTKNPVSTQDLLMKIAVPMGLVMLAIVLVIFFPKMYGAITEGSATAFQGSKEAVFEWLGQNAPRG